MQFNLFCKSLLLHFFLLTSLSLFSQIFSAGPVIGLNFSQVDGDTYGGYNKIGQIIGAFSRLQWNEKIFSQFEINYIGKGSRKYPNPKKNDFIEYILRLQYIEVPVIFQYSYKLFTYEAGLYYDRLIKKYIADQYGEKSEENWPFKKNEIGWLAGVNAIINDKIVLNLRYSYSLTPVRDHFSKAKYLLNRGWANNVVNFSFRYIFNPGKVKKK